MLTVRVVAGAAEGDYVSDNFDSIRVQVHIPDSLYPWRTVARYRLEERQRALACAKEVEQLPTAPTHYFGDKQPECVLYVTGVPK